MSPNAGSAVGGGTTAAFALRPRGSFTEAGMSGTAPYISAQEVVDDEDEMRTMLSEFKAALKGLYSCRSNLKQTQKNVRLVRTSANQVLSLVNDIMDLSKIEAGKFSLKDEEVDLVSLVENAAALLAASPIAQAQSVKIYTAVDPLIRAICAQRSGNESYLLEMPNDGGIASLVRTCDVSMRGDSLRISQLISNLISNAIKFTNDGSVTVAITFLDLDVVTTEDLTCEELESEEGKKKSDEATMCGNAVFRLDVMDEGCGIPNE